MTAARGGVWFSESEALSPTHSQSSAAFRAWNLVGHFTEEPWFVPWETDRLARLSTWTILKMDGSTSHQVLLVYLPSLLGEHHHWYPLGRPARFLPHISTEESRIKKDKKPVSRDKFGCSLWWRAPVRHHGGCPGSSMIVMVNVNTKNWRSELSTCRAIMSACQFPLFSMFTGCLDLPSNYLIGNHVIYLPAMTFKEVPDMLADILNPFLKVQTSKC